MDNLSGYPHSNTVITTIVFFLEIKRNLSLTLVFQHRIQPQLQTTCIVITSWRTRVACAPNKLEIFEPLNILIVKKKVDIDFL